MRPKIADKATASSDVIAPAMIGAAALVVGLIDVIVVASVVASVVDPAEVSAKSENRTTITTNTDFIFSSVVDSNAVVPNRFVQASL